MSEHGQRGNDVGKPRDKFPIEVTETKEGMNCFDRLQWRPSSNGRQLGRVHMDAATSNYHAKELNLRFVKFTFGQFERKVKAAKLLEDEVDFAVKVFC